PAMTARLAINCSPHTDHTSPHHDSTPSGFTAISISTSTSHAIFNVQPYRDNTLIHVGYASPYTFTWDTTLELNGSHVLTAIAYDPFYHTAVDHIGINVSNNGSGTNSPHPGDSNGDFHLTLNEATTYAFCWKSEPDIPAGCPSGASLEFAVRAGTIWNGSQDGSYHFDTTKTC